MTTREKRRYFANLIKDQEVVLAPGVFDMVSAKLAERESH